MRHVLSVLLDEQGPAGTCPRRGTGPGGVRTTGIRVKAGTEPRLALWDPQIIDKLVAQFEDERPDFGAGGTLMFSQFTDPFSVPALPLGITRAALELVFERTRFRVRVLTKNASVGGKEWLELFIKHRNRVVVGLSIGTLDDVWAKKMEVDTSPPSARIHALHRLQDAGVPTFGMLCPIFPEVMEGDRLERLVEATRPPLVEHLSAEPFNDRSNWMNVRDAYKLGTDGYQWMTDVFDTQVARGSATSRDGADTRPSSTSACSRRRSATGRSRSSSISSTRRISSRPMRRGSRASRAAIAVQTR